MIIGKLQLLLILYLSVCECSEPVVYTISTKKLTQVLDPRFISFNVDPSDLLQGRPYGTGLNSTLAMLKGLSPAYIRFGSPDSNKFVFQTKLSRYTEAPVSRNEFVITENHWVKVNELAREAGLNVLVCLNPGSERRDKDKWDTRNALELISFSDGRGYNLTFQLGYEVPPHSQGGVSLGKDYNRLRTILDAFPRYQGSKLVGPDVTVLHKKEELDFINDFLIEAGGSLDALTWHPRWPQANRLELADDSEQGYEFPPDYLDWDRQQLNKVLQRTLYKKPIWIGESKTENVGTFSEALLWARRLALAARSGVQVVLKQPYLVDIAHPKPEYWTALLHKQLMAASVLDARSIHNTSDVTVTAHCAGVRYTDSSNSPGAVTVYAVNTGNSQQRLSLKGVWTGKAGEEEVHHYVLTSSQISEDSILSQMTYLNGEPLLMTDDGLLPHLVPRIKKPGRSLILKLPPYSIAFWVFPEAKVKICENQPQQVPHSRPDTIDTSNVIRATQKSLQEIRNMNQLIVNKLTNPVDSAEVSQESEEQINRSMVEEDSLDKLMRTIRQVDISEINRELKNRIKELKEILEVAKGGFLGLGKSQYKSVGDMDLDDDALRAAENKIDGLAKELSRAIKSSNQEEEFTRFLAQSGLHENFGNLMVKERQAELQQKKKKRNAAGGIQNTDEQKEHMTGTARNGNGNQDIVVRGKLNIDGIGERYKQLVNNHVLKNKRILNEKRSLYHSSPAEDESVINKQVKREDPGEKATTQNNSMQEKLNALENQIKQTRKEWTNMKNRIKDKPQKLAEITEEEDKNIKSEHGTNEKRVKNKPNKIIEIPEENDNRSDDMTKKTDDDKGVLEDEENVKANNKEDSEIEQKEEVTPPKMNRAERMNVIRSRLKESYIKAQNQTPKNREKSKTSSIVQETKKQESKDKVVSEEAVSTTALPITEEPTEEPLKNDGTRPADVLKHMSSIIDTMNDMAELEDISAEIETFRKSLANRRPRKTDTESQIEPPATELSRNPNKESKMLKLKMRRKNNADEPEDDSPNSSLEKKTYHNEDKKTNEMRSEARKHVYTRIRERPGLRERENIGDSLSGMTSTKNNFQETTPTTATTESSTTSEAKEAAVGYSGVTPSTDDLKVTSQSTADDIQTTRPTTEEVIQLSSTTVSYIDKQTSAGKQSAGDRQTATQAPSPPPTENAGPLATTTVAYTDEKKSSENQQNGQQTTEVPYVSRLDFNTEPTTMLHRRRRSLNDYSDIADIADLEENDIGRRIWMNDEPRSRRDFRPDELFKRAGSSIRAFFNSVVPETYGQTKTRVQSLGIPEYFKEFGKFMDHVKNLDDKFEDFGKDVVKSFLKGKREDRISRWRQREKRDVDNDKDEDKKADNAEEAVGEIQGVLTTLPDKNEPSVPEQVHKVTELTPENKDPSVLKQVHKTTELTPEKGPQNDQEQVHKTTELTPEKGPQNDQEQVHKTTELSPEKDTGSWSTQLSSTTPTTFSSHMDDADNDEQSVLEQAHKVPEYDAESRTTPPSTTSKYSSHVNDASEKMASTSGADDTSSATTETPNMKLQTTIMTKEPLVLEAATTLPTEADTDYEKHPTTHIKSLRSNRIPLPKPSLRAFKTNPYLRTSKDTLEHTLTTYQRQKDILEQKARENLEEFVKKVKKENGSLVRHTRQLQPVYILPETKEGNKKRETQGYASEGDPVKKYLGQLQPGVYLIPPNERRMLRTEEVRPATTQGRRNRVPDVVTLNIYYEKARSSEEEAQSRRQWWAGRDTRPPPASYQNFGTEPQYTRTQLSHKTRPQYKYAQEMDYGPRGSAQDMQFGSPQRYPQPGEVSQHQQQPRQGVKTPHYGRNSYPTPPKAAYNVQAASQHQPAASMQYGTPQVSQGLAAQYISEPDTSHYPASEGERNEHLLPAPRLAEQKSAGPNALQNEWSTAHDPTLPDPGHKWELHYKSDAKTSDQQISDKKRSVGDQIGSDSIWKLMKATDQKEGSVEPAAVVEDTSEGDLSDSIFADNIKRAEERRDKNSHEKTVRTKRSLPMSYTMDYLYEMEPLDSWEGDMYYDAGEIPQMFWGDVMDELAEYTSTEVNPMWADNKIHRSRRSADVPADNNMVKNNVISKIPLDTEHIQHESYHKTSPRIKHIKDADSSLEGPDKPHKKIDSENTAVMDMTSSVLHKEESVLESLKFMYEIMVSFLQNFSEYFN